MSVRIGNLGANGVPEVVSTDTLMDVVWGPARSAAQVNTLQRHISYLRDVLGGRTLIVARPLSVGTSCSPSMSCASLRLPHPASGTLPL